MRTLKLAIFAIGGLIGLVVLAAIAVALWVDPNDYRGEIEARAQQATGRPLRIGGKLDLKLFPWIALQVQDVSLGNPPGYGSEPFLTVKRADVGVKLLPLLRKEVEVRRVTIEGLSVSLVSRSDEDNNWKDLAESQSPQSPGPAPKRTSVAGIELEDGALSYRDEVEKTVTRLTHLNVRTGSLVGDAPVPVEADFDYDDGKPDSRIHFDLKGSARIPPGSSRVEMKDLALKGRPGEKDTAFTVSSPLIVLDFKTETLAPTTLAIQYGELPLKATAAGQKLFSDRLVAGKIEVPRVSPRDLMKSMGMDAPKARDARALTSFAAKGDYRLTENALALEGLTVDLDDTHMRGRLAVDNLDTNALSFDLDVDSIDVDRYREPEMKAQEEKTQGKAAQAPPTDLPHDAIRDLTARGELRIGRLKVADMQLTSVRLPVEAAGGRMQLSPQAKMFGGSYDGNIQLDATGEKLRMTMNDHIRNVDAGALANAAFESRRLAGRADANIALSGGGKTDQELIRSLAGKFDVNVREGAVNGVDLWYELRRALALVKRNALPTRTEPVRTQFKTMTGSAILKDGIVRNDDLRIDMDYLKARGQGTLGVQSTAIDYRLVAQVYKLPPSGEGAEMADVKALDIPVVVTGTLADMKVRPDVADLVKARVRKEVDKHKEDLKKKLDDKLKGLFDR